MSIWFLPLLGGVKLILAEVATLSSAPSGLLFYMFDVIKAVFVVIANSVTSASHQLFELYRV